MLAIIALSLFSVKQNVCVQCNVAMNDGRMAAATVTAAIVRQQQLQAIDETMCKHQRVHVIKSKTKSKSLPLSRSFFLFIRLLLLPPPPPLLAAVDISFFKCINLICDYICTVNTHYYRTFTIVPYTYDEVTVAFVKQIPQVCMECVWFYLLLPLLVFVVVFVVAILFERIDKKKQPWKALKIQKGIKTYNLYCNDKRPNEPTFCEFKCDCVRAHCVPANK